MKPSFRKQLCLLLALALVLALLPGLRLPAAAAGVAVNSSNFPDANFRSFVAQYDTGGDGSLSSAELAAVETMDCSGKSISSLKGVEYFTSLTILNCSFNSLSTLDVSKNQALERLICNDNQLTSLNLKSNPALIKLSCHANGLMTLDLSKNPKLRYLECDHNYLYTLDVSKNRDLYQLICSENRLPGLDLSHNTQMTLLVCTGNRLTELKLGKNKILHYVVCENNPDLKLLDISGAPHLLDAYFNGSCEELSTYYKYINSFNILFVDKSAEIRTVAQYPLKICGVQVTETNRADVLGDGVFTFDGARMLTVKGSCSASQHVIENEGIDGLRIRVLQDAVLSTTASNCILARDDTRVTGPGKLTLKSTNSSGAGIFAIEKNVAVTVEQADLEIRAKYGIVGPDGTNAAHLTLDHSTVYVVESIGGAIIDFGGGITLRNERLYAPAGGGVSEAGDAIVTSYGSAANVVQILKTGWKNPFTDVPQDKYYYTPALWAYFRDPQITNGTSATTFGPAKECKREQVMTFLWKAAGAPEPETASCPFTDVPKTKYYYKPILWAVENGITGGVSATKFGVGKPCTREQIVTFLWKYAGAPEPLADSCPFTDVPKTKYYYEPILWAVENGITGGVSAGKFGVGKTCTRGQVVTFLYKLMVG